MKIDCKCPRGHTPHRFREGAMAGLCRVCSHTRWAHPDVDPVQDIRDFVETARRHA